MLQVVGEASRKQDTIEAAYDNGGDEAKSWLT
jgi:hypothetical protein